MKLGFTSMNTPSELPLDELARALEDRGFESLFVGEHSHIPTSRATPYPAGGDLPAPYLEMMDPYVGLMLAATASTTLLLGTGVALPLERDLFAQAKAVATLDRLSGGRFLFGVGVGWNVEELANHRPDIAWSRRYQALAECVEALRRLWNDHESEFHGEFFDFDPVWCLPGPAQDPHPPILCGTAGKLGTRHAVEWADGWMPTDVGLGDVAKKIGLFRSATQAAGRDPIPITMVVFGDPSLADLEVHRGLGVDRVVVGAARTGWGDGSTTLAYLDRYAEMVPRLA